MKRKILADFQNCNGCMYICMYVCMYVCMYGWVYGWMYTCIHLFENSVASNFDGKYSRAKTESFLYNL